MPVLFRRRSLRPSWEFTTRGIIWRLQPASGGMLVGEERDLDSKTASFFCIDPTGIPLWKEKNFGEQWWTGIEAVHRGVLFLHGYATPDLPGHQRIIAVDCTTARVLWKNDEVTFQAVAGDRVYASRRQIDGRLVVELDHRSGAFIREHSPGEKVSVPADPGDDSVGDVTLPLPLAGAGPLAELLHAVARAPAGGAEYVECDPYVVFAFHEPSAEPLGGAKLFRSQIAVVMRRTGKPVHQATIDPEVSAPAGQAFLVRGDVLYYVRGRRTLTAVSLRPE